MITKKAFEVKIYFSGLCSYEIEAENENEAILKARKLPINNKEILSNLENWKEADIAIEIEHEKTTK